MSENTVPKQERDEDTLKAYNLLAQGKRNMICREYNTAVNQYQEACELLAKWYGEMGKELAEPYFRYGSALLELARAESGVFGPALPGMDDEDDDEEDEAESSEEQGEKTSDENDDGDSATTKENSADESASQEGSPSAEDKKEEEKTDEKTEGETKKEAGKTDDAQAGCSKDEDGKEKEEEDESNLKLAWEMLELAKVLFLRSETKEDQLKAAECYIKLGEIGLESDTIEGAILDFKSSLEIQLKHVEPHNRVLAETHYQLGMAYGMAGDMENSAESYRQAAKSIKNKIEVLEKMTEGAAADKGKAPAAMDDPIANAQDELRELKELLPDIEAKVEEAEVEARNSMEAARKLAARAFGLEEGAQGVNPFAAFSAAASAGFGSSSSTAAGFGSSSSTAAGGSGFSSSSKPLASSTSEAAPSSVSNITHLVRKKRKPEGEDGDCGVEVKRTRSENGTGEAACGGSQGQQSSGDSAATTEKQTAPAPVAAVSGDSA